MMKRASDRYTNAKDMADDLHLVVQSVAGMVSPPASAVPIVGAGSTPVSAPLPPTSRQSDSDERPIKIVPKGLRSFDEHDADFFLELLPGPRDRDGLPESIRFWKRKIEQIDPDETFRVGLIYGPSGCGKSSLVKAGLLPRLAKHVHPVYIEATSEETETRLLNGLRKVCPELPAQARLVDSLAAIRHGKLLITGQKVLLVLDQFEQWLHATRGKANTELVAALRQCDGAHAQAVVMVRDDFWMAATSFFDDLETDLILRQNAAAVDLFDPRHAHKVLRAFGTVYGKLPERTGDFSRDEHAFLDQAIAELVQGGKIIPVQLSLFAEMLKGKPWTFDTLHEIGGTQGVGLTFLEETFSASTAPPEHRHHRKAAQAVLKALLPETGTDIKGQMRSRQELLNASGYANRPREFDDLIRILDSDLRLITPTDPEGSLTEIQHTIQSGQYYQLAHDYLVHSLREWLIRKQRETRRGRAQLRLEERSLLWNAKPENRNLPSALEWANIRLLTKKKDWTTPQCKMMRKVQTRHLVRGVLFVLIGLAAGAGIEVSRYFHAATLVEQLKVADTQDIGRMISQFASCRRWANPRLVKLLTETPPPSKEHLHASLALLPVDTRQIDYLYQRMLNVDGVELSVIIESLKPYREQLVPKLWIILDSTEPGTISSSALLSPPSPSPSKGGQPPTAAAPALDVSPYANDSLLFEKIEMPARSSRILRIAAILAHYDPASQRWEKARNKICSELVRLDPVELAYWVNALRPIKEALVNPLMSMINEDKRPPAEKNIAAVILRDYGIEPEKLKPAVMLGD
jgi:hypothetical protein